jgi:1-deoxy-D-xylulose-5-phosphate synthase
MEMEKPDTNTEAGNKYPLLHNINSPADLRQLPQSALPEVCAEIREFLINSLSKNPGHFASSMGAVEITVALHYVFNTPYDRIVWDVGHQAYGHKLLTGRRDRFDTNRKYGGISGFPNPDESEYDTFTAGHASNSISAALGMAVASKMKGESPARHVVAVIGDASISGGLAFEGLNNAAITPNNLLIILNDNDMSIDHNVGSLNSYLTHINTTKAYNTFRYNVYRVLRKMHLVGERSRGFILRFNNSIKSLISKQQNIFEGLNIRYFGPFDGHDIDRVVRVLNDIKDMEGPRILHLRTVKGKGYRPAEEDPAKWHAPGLFDVASGKRMTETGIGPSKWQDVFGETLLSLACEDNRIVGITAAMPSGTSMSTMQNVMPSRVFDVGISEGHAVTFAGGLAKDGMRPFAAIYSSFTQRAYDQIINDTAIQRLPVTLCLDRAGIVGEDGVTHHGVFDMCYLRPIPGIIVSSPMDELTLRSLMLTSVKTDHGPFVIRYPRGKGYDAAWREKTPNVLPIGKGRKLRNGTDMAILSIGPIGRWAATAAQRASEVGVSVAHYDMIFLKPLDEEILQEVATANVPIITVEDGMRNGGLGSAVAEWMSDHGYNPEIVRIGIPDRFVAHGKVPELMKECGMDEDAIYAHIKDIAEKHSFQHKES